MAKLSIVAGATSQSVTIFIQDSSSTVGAGLSGLVFNTSGLIAYYTFTGANAGSTAITLATLAAVNSAFSSGGFKEIDATNMKGLYRLDLPNAALATSKGQSSVIQLGGATNMATCVLEIELTGWNNQDGVHGGLTCLPNTAVTTNASLITSGTGTDQLQVTGGGGAPDWAHIKSPTTSVDLSGTTISGLDNASAVNVTKWNGQNVATPITNGVPIVDWLPSGWRQNTATAGANGSITLDAGASATTGFYKYSLIMLIGGTGAGQARLCTAYNGGTQVATIVPNWTTNPDNTSKFATMPLAIADIESWLATVVTAATAGIPDVNTKNYNNVAAQTDANNLPKTDLEDIAGSAVSTSTAQLGVNLVNIAGSAVATTTAQLGVNVVKYNNHTALTDANNLPEVDVEDIVGSAVATGSAQLGVNLVNVAGSAVSTTTAQIGANVVSFSAASGLKIAKNVALANFAFLMVLSSDHVSPATGLTVAVQRSIDGGAFGNSTNTPATEIANGVYKISLSAADLNGDIIVLKMTSATADQRTIIIATEP
jgi:hypothetical protein